MTLPTSCAHPTVGAGKRSTYTILGFTGYGVAALVVASLASAWHVTLIDRCIAFVVPPLAFLAVIAGIRRRVGREVIVFYQTSSAAVLAATGLSMAIGSDPSRVLDLATLGIGCFLVLGRLGCFSVACCHGVPARWGITYGADHVAVGFWSRWAGRPLWPTQLAEALASLSLVIAGIVGGWERPGLPALIYIIGYAPIRFALELVRGDGARPHVLGVSEAQWTSFATVVVCALWWPCIATLAIACALASALGILIARREHRALVQPRHLRELDRATVAVMVDGGKHETSLGVAITRHVLPDGRTDWILSATHPKWTLQVGRDLAALLWSDVELVEGRTAPIIHAIVPAPARGALSSAR